MISLNEEIQDLESILVLLIIEKEFPMTIFQVKQLEITWQQYLDKLTINSQTLESELTLERRPKWRSRIINSISKLINFNLVEKCAPYSMQHQRYKITKNGLDIIGKHFNLSEIIEKDSYSDVLREYFNQISNKH